MSVSYVITTDFAAKDTLPLGNPTKVVRGTEFTTEFESIQTAFTLCAPVASPTFTGTATFTSISAAAGTIEGVDIGQSTPGLGTFTTLGATTGNITTLTVSNATVNGSLDMTNGAVSNVSTLGATTVNATTVDATTVTADNATLSSVDVNGGNIDGTAIGSSVASTGSFSSVDINGGAIDGTTIGGAVAAAGTFTTVTANGGNSTNWNTAYGWGDHATQGYLVDGDVAGGNPANLLNDSDFASQGLMKRNASSGSYSIVVDNSTNWDTAYGWGDHGAQDYLQNNVVFPGTLWKLNASGTNLYFTYNDNNLMRLTSTGDLEVEGDITAVTTV
jgi:hypothetical protein